MIRGHCTDHPGAKLQCPVCNGSKTSKAKTLAAQENAKKGGRPPRTEEQARADIRAAKVRSK